MGARRRLYASQLPDAPTQLALDDSSHRHAQVLRLRPGDPLRLFDGRGREADATIVRCDKRELICDVSRPEQLPARAERLRLAVCIPKAGKLELIVKMVTELGVGSIQLLISERSVPKFGSDAPKLERLQRIAIEACAQSEQSYVPELMGPAHLDSVLAALPSRSLKLACVERSGGVADLPLSAADCAPDVWVLVGPEGGLTSAEQRALAQHDVASLSLGPTILRVETACVAACALLLSRMRARP